MQSPKYALVLSDLHFGDTRCSLHSMRTAHALVERLTQYKPLQEIYLLGDILDLQLATWSQAIEGRILEGPNKRAVGFRYFLNFLIQQTGAKTITYIPGNHDYKIFDYHSIDRHLIHPLKKRKEIIRKGFILQKFYTEFFAGIGSIHGHSIPGHLSASDGAITPRAVAPDSRTLFRSVPIVLSGNCKSFRGPCTKK